MDEFHFVTEVIKNSPKLMELLLDVRKVNLPQGCIAAGAIRNSVWQTLHGQKIVLDSDVDVVFFDEYADIKESKIIENQLSKLNPTVNWQVKNEAYMADYDFPGVPKFKSVEDAISNFVETPTSVAAYLSQDNQINLIAPYGLDDLVSMVVKPVPRFSEGKWRDVYLNRMRQKQWLIKWPNLTIER